MGLFGSIVSGLDGAADSKGSAAGSAGMRFVNAVGGTSNWGDSINTPSKIATTPAVGLEGGEWGAHFGGKSDWAPYRHIFGYNAITTKVNPAHHKSITEHSHTTAYHSAHHSDFTASESKHNTTQYKKKP
jgi:hypothetical protein